MILVFCFSILSEITLYFMNYTNILMIFCYGPNILAGGLSNLPHVYFKQVVLFKYQFFLFSSFRSPLWSPGHWLLPHRRRQKNTTIT